MKIGQINIQRSLPTKVVDICALAEEEKLDIVAVCETGLCGEICFKDHNCTKLQAILGWHWLGEARNNRGGGVGF